MLFFVNTDGDPRGGRRVYIEDRKKCMCSGPCGVGETAVYLGGHLLNRIYCVPLFCIERIYKRIAMSKNGFTGRGAFGSLPYLVVEFTDDSGKKREQQCLFRRESDVDRLLEIVRERFPSVPTHSEEAQRRLEEREARAREKAVRLEECEAADSIKRLQEAAEWLEKEPEKYQHLSRAARRSLNRERSSTAWRLAPFAFIGASAFFAVAGCLMLRSGAGQANGLLLLILAVFFLLAGLNVFPTGRNSAAWIKQDLEEALQTMEDYVSGYPSFPVPARYAHPTALRWMQDILAYERAKDEAEALNVLKEDLQALNSSMTVDQDVYDAVVQIKPLFLVSQYR